VIGLVGEMSFEIQVNEQNIGLEIKGGVTARDVGEMARALAASLKSGSTVVLETAGLEDVDTSVLQMLVSLRKTVSALLVENPSEVFVNAVDRCALRRELLGAAREPL